MENNKAVYCQYCTPGKRLMLGKFIDGKFYWKHGEDELEFIGNGKVNIKCRKCGNKTEIIVG